jgi:DNA repair exonuclease SbcCD ATPase subunit
VRILAVTIKDFLAIGQMNFSLYDQGLVLVQGENRDNPSANSNGSGKSSMVDAVSWVLYGETARGVDGVGIVRSGAKEACVSLALEDEDSGVTYVVVRTRSKTKTTLTLTSTQAGVIQDLTQGTVALTQAKLTAILGSSAEVFRAAVYLGQENMPDLPALTDKRLKELIEEAAGLSVIEACYERARVLAADHEAKLNHIKAQIALLDAQITTHASALEASQEDFSAWTRQQGVRLSQAQTQLKDSQDRQRALQEGVTKLEPLEKSVTQRLAEITHELAGFEIANDRAKTRRQELLEAERVVVRSEATARQAIERLKIQEAHLHHIGTGHPCESCGQALQGATLDDALAGARSAVENAQGKAREAARDVRDMRERVAQARSAAAAAEAAIPDVTLLQSEATEHRRLIDCAQAQRRELHEATREAKRAEADMKALRAETNPHSEPVHRQKAVLSGLSVTRASMADNDLVAQEERLAEAKSVVAVFGPAGVRAEILDQVTPYLNARTAAYLDTLSDGTLKALWTTLVRDAKGNLKEKFCIEVTHPAGEGFAALSGGEKRKVRIATALALQDLVASRASKPLRLWVADEIDDALDDAGLERLMGVLGEKAREKGTVLVISHNSLTDWIPNAWTVAKSGGVATLETC